MPKYKAGRQGGKCVIFDEGGTVVCSQYGYVTNNGQGYTAAPHSTGSGIYTAEREMINGKVVGNPISLVAPEGVWKSG